MPMWMVATCYNGYQNPTYYRIAYNVDTEEWMVDPGAEWLVGPDAPKLLDVSRKPFTVIDRRVDPEAWMEALPQAFHGSHASASVTEVENLIDLPPMRAPAVGYG